MTGFLRRSRRSDGGKSGMEMTSMIDVVFLLLIFFMCATQFRSPEGRLRAFLPRDTGPGDELNSPEHRKCRIVLRQEANGETVVIVDRRTIPNDQQGEYERTYLPGRFGFDQEELEEHLRLRVANYVGMGPRGLPVILDFAEDVPYGYVIQALNVCQRAEIQDIGFAIPERDAQ